MMMMKVFSMIFMEPHFAMYRGIVGAGGTMFVVRGELDD